MNLFSKYFFLFFLRDLLFFLFHLFFVRFQTLIDTLCMMEFLCSEISFEQCSFQFISKLYLIKFNQRPSIILTFKIFISINRSIMFSSAKLIPLQSNPYLLLTIGRLAFMFQPSNISDSSHTIIKDNSSIH